MLVQLIFSKSVNRKKPVTRPPNHLGSSRLNQGQLLRGCGAFYHRPEVVVFPKQSAFDSFMIEKSNFTIFVAGFGTFNFGGMCLRFFMLQRLCSKSRLHPQQSSYFFRKLLLLLFAFQEFACWTELGRNAPSCTGRN